MFRVIVNCGRCEPFIGACLASLRHQTYTDWQAQVTIDRRGDRTYERALEARGNDERIVVTRNAERLFPMTNIIAALQRADASPDDVVVILDGDDWFIDDRALERIAHAYENGAWLTYGSWIGNRLTHPGLLPPYPDDTRDFRDAPWLATAVRTFRKWLFDLIDPADLKDDRGQRLRVCEDIAYMYPMLEMATTRRAHHIAEPLMLYNLMSEHDPGSEFARESDRIRAWLRGRPRYAPIHKPAARAVLISME